MDAVVALLDQGHSQAVDELWTDLEREHGIRGARAVPWPHVSWHVAGAYDREELDRVLGQVAAETVPLRIRTAGLTVFTGPAPVVCLAVVRTRSLDEVHARLWERLSGIGRDPSPLYAPDSWMPHVTLAWGDLSSTNVGAAVRSLATRPLAWDMELREIAAIEQPEGRVGTLRLRLALDG